MPIDVDGPGLIDCHLYEQPGRMILHLVNLTSEATWRAPLDELIKVGPFTVKIALPAAFRRPVRLACWSSAPARPVTVAERNGGVDGGVDSGS